MSSRTQYVKKNIFYGYSSNMITSILSIVTRTIFVRSLGVDYLGVSGLFSNVLGLLSFSELGIGTAINFSLYKPIAENDDGKIKSLLNLYKKAYRIIALIVAVFGVLLLPFLEYLVNTDIPMSEIRVFYLVFLFNTVTSYFVTYKTSYISAIQKNYIVTNAQTIATIVTNFLQIIVLLFGGDYLLFLIIACIVGVVQKIVLVVYLDKKYRILTEKECAALDIESKDEIVKNVKALIIHKIGDVAVNQTDNIIISAFISTSMVGFISNYVMISKAIEMFTNSFFSSFTAGFGNMIAKESKDKHQKIFDIYDLLGFWIYGFVLLSFIVLSQAFICLWLGKEMLIDDVTMILYFVAMYFSGITFIPYNFKVAAGRFDEDKWVAFVQAVTNLLVSVFAVKIIGLPGVYVGTIVQRMVVVFVRPSIVYKYILNKSVLTYYVRLLKRTCLLAVICVGMWWLKNVILCEVTIIRFIIMCFLTLIVPNIIFYLVYRNSEPYKEIVARIKRK